MIYWAVIGCIALVSGCYIGWLVLFEHWLEPRLRRWGGAVVGSSIVWVPAGGPFRIWGLRERATLAAHAAVGFLGGITVLLAALLPAAALLVTIARARAGDATLAASGYLVSLPMVAFFAFHVCSLKPEVEGGA